MKIHRHLIPPDVAPEDYVQCDSCEYTAPPARFVRIRKQRRTRSGVENDVLRCPFCGLYNEVGTEHSDAGRTA